MNTSGFNYTGDVKMLLVDKNGKKTEFNKHNEGYNALFQIFSKVLAGVKISDEDVPKSIDIRYTSGSVQNSCLLVPIDINKKYGFDGEKYVTIIEAMLTYSNFSIDVSTYDNSTLFNLCLLDGNSKLLASTQVSHSYVSRVKPGTQVFIEWTLYVTNPVSN